MSTQDNVGVSISVGTIALVGSLALGMTINNCCKVSEVQDVVESKRNQFIQMNITPPLLSECEKLTKNKRGFAVCTTTLMDGKEAVVQVGLTQPWEVIVYVRKE